MSYLQGVVTGLLFALSCAVLVLNARCSVVPAATHVDQVVEHDQVTIDACQQVSRDAYRNAGRDRDAGLAAFDSCIREAGL